MNDTKKFFGFGKNVTVAGLVSLFMDISSEMIYPLVPLFLANVIGIDKSLIGLVEGVAESTASLLKAFSGWFSDRTGNRKWWMAAGYGISVLSRPFMAVAAGWHQVMGARFIDRFGKGIRTAPRDTIIAESADRAYLGRAFSFHRSMDTLGAMLGPALAFFLLRAFDNDYRKIFWISTIPGAIAVLLIVFFIVETRKSPHIHSERPKLTWKQFNWQFRWFMVIAGVFALGNSSDVFLILKAQQVGVATPMIPVVYLMFNLVYSVSAIPAGIAADRFGKQRIILGGFVLFAALYWGFAVASQKEAIWVLFGLYGIFMGLTEGIQKAFLATIIPADFKATGFGVFNMVGGIATLPASLAAGWLWDKVSPAATFYYGAVMAALSAMLFGVFLSLGKNRHHV